MQNGTKKVSVIVPVYNVAPYIDQCMESICGQTYKNLEVIIIYDESSDASLERCRQWADSDHRIRLHINPKRTGLGFARNVGLHIAEGAYVVFVDSDDWLAEGFIEKLYHTIEETGADYVSSVGYYCAENNEVIQRITTLPAGTYDDDIGRLFILLKEAPAVWKKIYNMEWLMKNELFQPETFYYEDWGYDIALVLQTRKIVLIPEIGVFYRFNPNKALPSNMMVAVYKDFRKTIEFGLSELRKRGIFDKYSLAIEKYILHDLNLRELEAEKAQNTDALEILSHIREDILEKKFGYQDTNLFQRYICMGSFSLRWIMQSSAIFEKNLEHFAFSSLISAFTPGKNIAVSHKNFFRKQQIEQDISGAFYSTIKNLSVITVLFLDFMEECNNIYQLGENAYMTESEAFLDAEKISAESNKRILSGSKEFMELWKEKCLDFIDILKQKKEYLTIIVVANRMSEKYGDFNRTEPFSQVKDIKEKNKMISNIEAFFLSKCEEKGIHVGKISLPEQYCFTDATFEYGCKPQYMNKALYGDMGYKIYEMFRKSSFKNVLFERQP